MYVPRLLPRSISHTSDRKFNKTQCRLLTLRSVTTTSLHLRLPSETNRDVNSLSSPATRIVIEHGANHFGTLELARNHPLEVLITQFFDRARRCVRCLLQLFLAGDIHPMGYAISGLCRQLARFLHAKIRVPAECSLPLLR